MTLLSYPPAIVAVDAKYPGIREALDCLHDEDDWENALRHCDALLTNTDHRWDGFGLNYTSVKAEGDTVTVTRIDPVGDDADQDLAVPLEIFRACLAELLRHEKGPVVHANGRIARREQYVDGKRHGEWALYYPDGMKKSSWSYAMGFRDGVWRWYYADGTPEGETGYRQGKLHGRHCYWFRNGQMRRSHVYSDGVPADGRSEEVWDEGGRLIYWAEYREGTLQRQWRADSA